MASDSAPAPDVQLPRPIDNLASSAGVTHEAARLWFRVADADPRHHRVRVVDARDQLVADVPLAAGRRFGDHVHVLSLPGALPDGRRLAPSSRYRYALLPGPDAPPLLEGTFETSPPPGRFGAEPFSFAVMSCHQPLDEHGRVDASALHMLEALPDVLEREHVKRVLMVGDQMYTDLPEPYSLFNPEYFASVAPPGREHILSCTAEEVRQLLHDRYRRAWGVAHFDRVQRRWPTYQIPDDHEFVDNFGSHPDHAGPAWHAFRTGALSACHDYELSRVLDDPTPPFDYTMDYGGVATFVMDLRSCKRADGHTVEMFAPEQLDALARFLEQRRDAAMVMVVFSVPLFHLPDWLSRMGSHLLAEGSDVHDRWSAPAARACRDAVVRVLKEHKRRCPDQVLLLLGGDVHVSLAAELRWDDLPRPVYQFTASPLSNNEGRMKAVMATLLGRMKAQLEGEDEGGVSQVRIMDGAEGSAQNPLAELNVGIVACRPLPDMLEVTLKLYTFDPKVAGRGKLVYRSAPLLTPLRDRLHERAMEPGFDDPMRPTTRTS